MITAVIVQARQTSRRFPGKSMADLAGKPVLEHVLERCLRIGADVVVLAVPAAGASVPMCNLATGMGCVVCMGPEDDVLSRYVTAADMVGADVILRVTGDCPLLDWRLARRVLDACATSGLDYVSNCWPIRSFPKGYDCEAFTREALDEADEYTTIAYDREHVTIWMQSHPWARLRGGQATDESHINWCVDEPEDIARLTPWASLRLVDVYERVGADALKALYDLLAEREVEQSISHRAMPSWGAHVSFCLSRPYEAWYLIENSEGVIGSVYLTHEREVGLFLFRAYHGRKYGSLALNLLRDRHPGPLYANVAPTNPRSQVFFERHGFRHIQNTYRLDDA